MRAVLTTEDEDEFSRAWNLLQRKGIPVCEQSSRFDSLGLDTPRTQGRVLCIWLDEQYEDARKLLRDPSHVVSNPVDLEEFARIQDELEAQQQQSADRFTEKFLNWSFALIAIAVIGATSNLASSAGNTVTKVTTFEDENGENPAACSLREAVRANNDMTDFGGCGFGGNREKNSIQLQDGVYKISESLGAIQVNRNLSIFGFDNGDYDHSDPLTGTRPLPKLPSTIIDGQSRTRIFDSTMKDAKRCRRGFKLLLSKKLTECF